MDISNNAVFIADSITGNIVYANKEASKLIGLPVNKLIGMHQSKLHPKKELPYYYKLFKSHIKNQKNFTKDVFIENQKGEKIPISIESYAYAIDKNKYLLGIFKPISHKIEAEKELILEKNKTQNYLDIASAMIIVYGNDQKVKMINKKGLQILECTEKDIVNKNWFDNFLPKEIRKKVKGVYNKLMSGRLEMVEYFENSVITKTGKEKLIAWHNSYIKDKNGKIIELLCSGQDITKQKESETWLNLFKEMIDKSNDLIYLIDFNTNKIIYANGTASKQLKYSSEEISKLKLNDIDKNIDYPSLLINIKKNKEITHNGTYAKHDNSIFHAQTNFKTIESGKNKYLIAVAKDITPEKLKNNEIQESKKRYENLIENANDIIQSVDREGKLIYVNRSWQKTLGYNYKEAKKLHFTDIIDPSHLSLCQNLFNEVLNGKDTIKDFMTIFKAKNGKKIYVDGSINVQREKGKFISTLGIFRDVTEKREFVEVIKETNDFLRNIIDSFPFPFYVIRTKDYSIKLANKMAIELAPNNKNPKCYQLSHNRDTPCDGKEHICPLKEVVKTKNTVIVEHMHYDKDDNQKIYEIRAYPIFDKDKNVIEIIEASLDITEQKEIENKIIHSEERYRAIFDTAPNLIISVDKNAKILDCNYKIEDMLAYNKQTIIGKKIHEIISLSDMNKINDILNQALTKGYSGDNEISLMTKNKKEIYSTLNVSLIKNIKDETQLVFIFDDISREKNFQDKLLKSEKKTMQKISELEKFTKLTVNRELMMVDLKKKIKLMEETIKNIQKMKR